MKINWYFFRRRGNLNSSSESDGYDNLQEQKPDRDCDDWENESLTEVIIASIEEETALDLNFSNKKFDKAVPFSCFSTETGQDTMKEVQGPLTV